MRAVLAGLLAAASLVAAPGDADAGRSYYGWLYGTEVIPKRGAEIQTWIYETNGLFDDTVQRTLFWWGAFVGVTDQLELVFPAEFYWQKVDGEDPSFTLEKFGLEARYRFVKTDLEKPDGIAPLLRVAAKRDVTVRDVTQLEADFVVSYQKGRVHALLDLGAVVRADKDDVKAELRPGGGISIQLKDELRVGVEGYGEVWFDEALKKGSWFGVGPNISWTHGRFWVSASMLVGVYQIETAPRAWWGILF